MQLFDPQAPGTLIPVLNLDESEVQRQMTVCNACRYCEGFCAVFPAMTRRLAFSAADIHYLANLCHNCGACLHACQYAAPHEFAINVPKAMAKVRLDTYAEYAWPQVMGTLYRRNGLTLALSSGAGLALFLCLTLMVMGNLFTPMPGGNFYGIFPHNTLALMFGAVFGFAVLALTIGVRRFWRNVSPVDASPRQTTSAALEATTNVATLKYLDGGHGEGCNNADDQFTLWRRRMHHFTFYGFMLCFAATGVATLYHFLLGWSAPYPVLSVPVMLGIAGGLGLLVGPAGLLWLNLRRNAEQGDEHQKPMDRGFIALLFLISASGLALLAFRETVALGLLLAIHLGLVMAFFLTMPYSKFAHGIFRSAALLKYSIEKRQPNPINAASD
ncbi:MULTISPECIES: tricarballylate utilization 4Fe-4S protein TcuB [unclassified Pseudomonas]|jgi:citrate/tricarballylate utilization protein|uniref:tricarballylate utilization 4Fe-4S protein TcuB n=1 Tax=unclassified Pseudomonas TaxID=196821 RepID=UPI000C884994|nr:MULTISPECIES: tricarballylate utilization 4Fe-4S protein TcuB [unclassified Pseudomonas]PMX24195.1 tricarballylate utilization protein TcuB [Pseudomonas sp. GW460-12]PMX32680.1 tricarballylate utilization protein TcuB [Pseudomonas sp. MPR-R2A4]PMX39719.1 tricarballylate utilization protein TcuB [Pseudomonas sp. MPR-R2A7]PMX53114.1 tricarballylate utilization protein TcuB [Pseudomonas sp. MPR-R2A6]PMX89463.1 tricarballylate utilization protein TcuB [Pseudomonas sp. MPR-R2A3]